jgi:hypothetical protein
MQGPCLGKVHQVPCHIFDLTLLLLLSLLI